MEEKFDWNIIANNPSGIYRELAKNKKSKDGIR
jgi:hypothetical protein